MSKKLEVLYREYEKTKKGYASGGKVDYNTDSLIGQQIPNYKGQSGLVVSNVYDNGNGGKSIRLSNNKTGESFDVDQDDFQKNTNNIQFYDGGKVSADQEAADRQARYEKFKTPGMTEYAKKQQEPDSDGSDNVDIMKDDIKADPTIGKMQAPSVIDFGKSVTNANKYQGGKIQNYSKGGKVEHNKKNLEELKKAFAKFINEEGSEKGYADGGEVEDSPGLTPEQFQQHIQDLQDQGKTVVDVNGDQQLINGQLPPSLDPNAQPADLEAQQNPDDKQLENELQNEDFEANEKAPDKRSPASDDSEDDSDEDETETADKGSDKTSDKEPASEQSDDQSAYSKLLASLNPNKSNALADAQRERDKNIALKQMEEGSALIGAGLSGQNPDRMLKLANEKDVNLPVEKYQEQLQNQKFDPNSPVSKVVSDYLTKKGFNLPPGTSANDAMTIMPFLKSDQTLQNALQKVIMQQQGANQRKQAGIQSSEGIANKKLSVEQQKADAMKQAAEGNKDLKVQAGQDRALQQTKGLLESARGNPAAAQAEKDMYSVDKANSLFKIYPDLNKIPDAQVNLITSEIAKIAQGGVPPGHEMDALKPNTPESKLQKLWGQVTNKPTGANLGAYLQELKKYTNALHGDAQKVIQDKYGRVIESSKKQLGDDNYKALQDQYLNRFKNQPSEENSHPQDSQAIEWAKSNSQDPRAAAILKANGIQ